MVGVSVGAWVGNRGGGFEEAIGVFDRLGDLGVESERLGDIAAGFADGAIVVDDEEVEEVGGLELRRMGVGDECGIGGGRHEDLRGRIRA